MPIDNPFKWRQFEPEFILLCVRWYLRYSLSYRDLEEMMRDRGQPPTILRSKTPELVGQELYATVIVYYVVRERIHQAAMETNKDARRISFLDSMKCIIDAIPHMSIAMGAHAQRQCQYLISFISECEIDRPQRTRINPRVVKVKKCQNSNESTIATNPVIETLKTNYESWCKSGLTIHSRVLGLNRYRGRGR